MLNINVGFSIFMMMIAQALRWQLDTDWVNDLGGLEDFKVWVVNCVVASLECFLHFWGLLLKIGEFKLAHTWGNLRTANHWWQ